jgi:hypothetical protein
MSQYLGRYNILGNEHEFEIEKFFIWKQLIHFVSLYEKMYGDV